jgi:hypothetical protein
MSAGAAERLARGVAADALGAIRPAMGGEDRAELVARLGASIHTANPADRYAYAVAWIAAECPPMCAADLASDWRADATRLRRLADASGEPVPAARAAALRECAAELDALALRVHTRARERARAAAPRRSPVMDPQ